MIKFADNKIMQFVRWLNGHYPTKEDVNIAVLKGFDSIEAIDGNKEGGGFAAYGMMPGCRVIFVADPEVMAESLELTDDDKWETALTNIAHEYRHHIQATEYGWPEEKMCSEEAENDAEEFANTVYVTYKQEWEEAFVNY